MLADICVLAIVVFFIWSGYKSGFMKAFVKVASYIISLIISFFLYPVISEFLIKTPIYDKLVEVIGQKYIMNNVSENVGQGTFGILSKYIEEGIQGAAIGIAESVAVLVVNIIAFIIILVLSKILIRVVGNLLGIFTKLPIIKQFNRLGGAVFGGLMGVLVLYILSAVFILFSPFDPQGTVGYEIENSTFASEIYENNIIIDFLGKGKQSG